jgi:RNA polymerase sigma-70 factor (ECF subfamily)
MSSPDGDATAGEVPAGPVASTTLALLARAQAGDRQALEDLLRVLAPRLKRWVTGRLPNWYRDLSDTDDLVQETMIRTLRALPDFEVRHEAALQVYLRQAVWNRLREEIRRARRRPAAGNLDDAAPLADAAASPVEQAVGRAALDRYEAALARLGEDERAAVVGRLEFGYSFPELAAMLGRRTPDAARKLVERSIPRLAEWMRDEG